MSAVPYIRGVAATRCKPDCGICKMMAPAFAPWICPHCKAHLGEALICLNLCGLSAASSRRFNALMDEAAARVAARKGKS